MTAKKPSDAKIPWFFSWFFKFHGFCMTWIFFLAIFHVFQSLWEPWNDISFDISMYNKTVSLDIFMYNVFSSDSSMHNKWHLDISMHKGVFSDSDYTYFGRKMTFTGYLGLYTDPKKKTDLHLNFLQTIVFFIQLFCFKKCDYLTMLNAKKKFIRCTFMAMTTSQAPVPKLRKSHT